MQTFRSPWVACATALVALIAVSGSDARAAQTAASIEYEVVARPAGLPEDFAAPPGTRLDFLAIKAIDGFRIDAALWQPGDRAAAATTLVLHGHSLGNIQVQFYAATNWDPDLKAVVLTGAFANLPWKSRHLLVQNEDNFRQLSEAAFASLRDGRADAVLPVRMGWITGQPVPVTGQHFLTYRWEPTSVADGTYWIRRIPRPILLVRDQGDAIIEPFEPYALLSAGTAAGSLAPSVKLIVMPNPRPRSAAAHGFSDNAQALIDAFAAWLAEQRL